MRKVNDPRARALINESRRKNLQEDKTKAGGRGVSVRDGIRKEGELSKIEQRAFEDI